MGAVQQAFYRKILVLFHFEAEEGQTDNNNALMQYMEFMKLNEGVDEVLQCLCSH